MAGQRILIRALVFFVVLAIFPFTAGPATDAKILGYELCAFAALALWLFTPRLTKKAVRRSSALFALFLAFLGVNFAATFVSPNVGYSLLQEFTKFAALFILFAVVADVFYRPEHVWSLFGSICVAVSIASVYGFIQSMGMDPFPWKDATRILKDAPSTFGSPNLAAHVVVPATILATGLCTQRKSRWALICLPLFLGHLTLTQTRGSILALVSAALLVVVGKVVSRKVKDPSWAIALTLSTVFFFAIISVATVAAFFKVNTGQFIPDETSLTYRYQSFYRACRMIEERPWLGHGPGMFEVVSPEYWTELDREWFRRKSTATVRVHNEPLEIATEAGLVAAVLYISILGLGIYYGLFLAFASKDSGRRRVGMTLAAFFLAFLVDGLFGFNVRVPASGLLLFLVAGATAGVWRERGGPTSRRALRYGAFPLLWRLAALAVATIIPILAIRDFGSQFYLQRGRGATQYEAYGAASKSFRKAASLAPYRWLPPHYLGFTAMSTRNAKKAAAHFSRTLQLNPNYVPAQFKMAESMFDLAVSSPEEEAIRALETVVYYAQRAAQLSPISSEVHDLLGTASFLRAEILANTDHGENTAEAEEAWRTAENHLLRAIANGSKREDRLYRLVAAIRFARDDVYGAEKALVESLQAKPDSLETWGLLRQFSQKSGRYDTIRNSLDWCIERLSRSRSVSDALVSLYLLRAEILYSGYNDESGSEDAFLQAVGKYPGRVDVWVAFHAFAKSVGREEVIQASLSRAFAGQEKAKENLPPLVQAVAIGLQEGENGIVEGVSRLASALQQHQATTSEPERTTAIFSWAADLLTARAQQISISPDDAGAVFLQLGLIYETFEDFSTAAQLLDQALPDLSGEQELFCLVRKGEALTKTDDTEAAVKAFEEAAARAPTNIEVRYAYARALARDEKRAQARLEYLSILASFELSEDGRTNIEQALAALRE